jgi:hypothetical protein
MFMDDYKPGLDQNQGVVGTMARNEQPEEDTELVGSRVPRMDPNIVTNETHVPSDEAGKDEANDG